MNLYSEIALVDDSSQPENFTISFPTSEMASLVYKVEVQNSQSYVAALNNVNSSLSEIQSLVFNLAFFVGVLFIFELVRWSKGMFKFFRKEYK